MTEPRIDKKLKYTKINFTTPDHNKRYEIEAITNFKLNDSFKYISCYLFSLKTMALSSSPPIERSWLLWLQLVQQEIGLGRQEGCRSQELLWSF